MAPAITKDEARKLVRGLVEKYLRDREKWRTRNESETRAQFLDPLLKALGWDFDSPEEVRMEVKVMDEESRMKLDYVFLINSVEKLIVEAKATREDISKIQYQRQAIEYAYNLSCSWSVLTNFEGLKIFYVAEEGIVFRDIELTNIERFDENFENLWLISRESFLLGTIERKAEDEGRKRRPINIDDDLLESLNDWRERIYRDIKFRYGKKYSDDLIEEIVQKVIDRLIFIRKIEDMRGKRILEPIVRQDPPELYKELKKIFAQFNEEYNSKLFGESKDDKHETDLIDLSNSTLVQVIEGMYKPKGRSATYNFAIIDVDILGQIYEQYLGHILKQKKIVEGKSHRREQGIYYTPKYIVDFIVRNTIGEILREGKVDRQKLRVLDPACGSGSFLIKAYDYLLRYRKSKEGTDAQARLDFEHGVTFTRKTQIVTENIFGVDLDAKAVEIAQLNLLLKIAELKERLPTLRNNIQEGNSLISDEKVSPRAFNWEERFGNIMKEGGFDVIIGNPPYERTLFLEKDKDYYEQHYAGAYGAYDILILFIERAIKLLKEGGYLGFIVSNKFLVSDYGKKIRDIILENCKFVKIVDLADAKRVFPDALVSTVIIILQKKKARGSYTFKRFIADKNTTSFDEANFEDIPITEFVADNGTFNVRYDSKKDSIYQKISKMKKFGDEFDIRTGIMGFEYWKMEPLIHEGKKNESDIRIATNSYLDRYQLLWGKKINLYKKNFLEPYADIKKMPINESTKNLFLKKDKLIVRGVARRLTAMIDREGVGFLVAVHSIVTNEKYSPELVLAILNSKLFDWIHKERFYLGRIPEGSLKYPVSFLKELPLPNSRSMEATKELEKLAKKMIDLNMELLALGEALSDRRKYISERIATNEAEIDDLVYKLYGITEGEKKLIESSM